MAGQLNDVDMRIANLEISGESTPLLAPYIGQSPSYASGSTSYAGFVLNDVAGVIGKGTSFKSRILFHELNNGIISINSSLLVTNSRFDQIHPDPVYSGTNGIGIRATRTIPGEFVLVVNGLGSQAATATFHDCDIGIAGQRVSMDVSENLMTQVREGITAWFSSGRTIKIYDNAIQTSYSGIRSGFGNFATEISIFNNEVALDDPSANANDGAVVIDENAFFGNTANLTVINNEITVVNGRNGMVYNATKYSKVYSNNVTLDDDVNDVTGIKLNYCYSNDISFNTVTGTSGSLNANLQTAFSTIE